MRVIVNKGREMGEMGRKKGAISAALKLSRARKAKAYPENTLQQRTTSNTTLQVLHLRSRLIDIETPNNNKLGCGRKVTDGDRDLGDNVLDEGVNVVPQLGRDGDDGSGVGNGSLDEVEDRLLVLVGLLLADKIDLVLLRRGKGI